MRRLDKKENMKKANLLAESVYKQRLIEYYDYSGEEIAHAEKNYLVSDKAKDKYATQVGLWLDKFVSNDELKRNIDKYADFIEQSRLAGIPVESTGQAIRNKWFKI